MPSPSRTEKKNVYSDSTLRRLFRQPRFAHLRQAKPVRLAIRQHHLSVWPYQEARLVQIVRELLQDCVFESDYIAQSHFPELFKSSRPQLPSVREPIDESSTVSSIHLSYVPPDLQISMRENILVQRAGLFASGKYSDLLIIGGKYYHAHKNIVFCYSAVLRLPVASHKRQRCEVSCMTLQRARGVALIIAWLTSPASPCGVQIPTST
ncbi:hypothetical protein CRV24_008758 [Beauveria bassiana]|nr:hypothetical protein CRV24_008758 [Beauveria bassiana]KAH8715279.1 hypothetical protein HC256_004118 [Beauveria bassiana]